MNEYYSQKFCIQANINKQVLKKNTYLYKTRSVFKDLIKIIIKKQLFFPGFIYKFRVKFALFYKICLHFTHKCNWYVINDKYHTIGTFKKMCILHLLYYCEYYGLVFRSMIKLRPLNMTLAANDFIMHFFGK